MTMTDRNVSKVLALCDEVANLAGRVRMELKADAKAMMAEESWAKHHDPDEYPSWITPNNPKLSGELRRRSMDLTRALAELRRH